MKKIFILLFLLLVPFPKSVHAESSVNITNENNSNCQTNVKITTNGETKTYNSQNCNENVDVQSSDGSSKVTIRNQAKNNTTSIYPTSIPTATASPTQKPSDGKKLELHESFLTRVVRHFQFLKKLFPWI